MMDMDLELLKRMSNLKTFKKGQTIIREGDSPDQVKDEMYILLKGSAEVHKNYGSDNTAMIAYLKPGSFFGEMSLFLGNERTATVIADDDSTLLAINRTNAYEFFEKQPEATFMLINSLCARLEAATNIMVGNTINTLPPPSIMGATPVPAAQTAPPSAEPAAAEPGNGLFPDGHKNYSLVYEPEDASLVYDRKFVCPMCENDMVLVSPKTNLKLLGMDKDFRPRHTGVDTVYYQPVTCPHCLFSTLEDSFKGVRGSKHDEFNAKMKIYNNLLPMFKEKTPTPAANKVLTSLYLTLAGAPVAYMRPEMITARVWMRISWMYADCGDNEMELYAAGQAQKAYILAYEKTDISKEQLQQLQLIIGELSLKLDDIETAKRYFFLARSCQPSKPPLRAQAEERLELIKQKK
jgi:hypothetical protein